MFRLDLRVTLPIDAPEENSGFVTWYEGKILAEDDDTGESTELGGVVMALIHVAEIRRRRASLLDALAADSSELEALHGVYFDEDAYAEAHGGGYGQDLLYLADVPISELYDGMDVDLAVVRRICASLGSGCRRVVLPYSSLAERQHFAQIGFVPSTPAAREGLMHWPAGAPETAVRPRRAKKSAAPPGRPLRKH